MTDRPTVTFTCPARGSRVVALAGDPATPSGGVGGNQVIDMPFTMGIVHWETTPPDALAVPVIFEGFDARRSIELPCMQLQMMGRALPGERRPPTVNVSGPVPSWSVAAWRIDGLDWGDVLRDDDGSQPRIRQAVTVQLIRDERAELAVSRRVPRRPAARYRAKPHVVKRGETLPRIAAKLHVPGGWRALAKANGIRDPKKLRAGQRLRVPA